MNCKECRQKLVDLVEGFLSPHEELHLKEHVDQCPSCRKELDRLRNTLSLIEEDAVPPLSAAKRQALFPLVMERVAERTARIRRRNAFAYSFGSVFVLAALLTVSIIGFRRQQHTDYYTIFFNPQQVLYSDDVDVNQYVLESLIGDTTVTTEIRNVADDAWINNSELTSLVEDLSDEEVGALIEKLETFDLNGG